MTRPTIKLETKNPARMAGRGFVPEGLETNAF